MMATDDLLFLSTDEFHDLVERDLRYEPDPGLLAAGDPDEQESAAIREALHSPEVIERYYYMLVGMSKRVDATLGARRAEYSRDKHKTTTDAEARALEQKYASQRSSTLRFKGGLDQHLANAKRLLNEHRGVQYDHLIRKIDTLETAIRKHKLSLETDLNQVASDYDVELWRVLDA